VVDADVAGVAVAAVAAVAAAWLAATAVSAAAVVAGLKGRSGDSRHGRELPLRCSRSRCAVPEGARARRRARLGSGIVGARVGSRLGSVRAHRVVASGPHAHVRELVSFFRRRCVTDVTDVTVDGRERCKQPGSNLDIYRGRLQRRFALSIAVEQSE
jgi:hypothetical protein